MIYEQKPRGRIMMTIIRGTLYTVEKELAYYLQCFPKEGYDTIVVKHPHEVPILHMGDGRFMAQVSRLVSCD